MRGLTPLKRTPLKRTPLKRTPLKHQNLPIFTSPSQLSSPVHTPPPPPLYAQQYQTHYRDPSPSFSILGFAKKKKNNKKNK